MSKAGIAALKARLSEFLARVRSGEEVVVTDRGRPVARLVPFRTDGDGPDDIADLVRSGVVTPARRQPDAAYWKAFWRMPMPRRGGEAVLEALIEERREGR